MYLPNNMHRNVHGIAAHNPKLKVPQMPIIYRMDMYYGHTMEYYPAMKMNKLCYRL